MSNAMRKGKRTLAGVAAGALGLALVPFVGIGAANAVVPSGTVTSVTGPTAARIATNFSLSIVGTALQTPAATLACSTIVSGPAGAVLTATGVAPTSATAATTTASVDLAGNYTLGVYLIDNTAGTLTCATAAPGSADASGILSQISVTVGGAVASAAITPATATVGTASNATYTIAATDAAGRATIFGSGDSYTLSTSTATVTTTPTKALSGQTAMSFTAQNSAAETATVTLTPSNNAVAAASASLTTVAPAAATAVAAIDPTPVTNTVPVGTTSVTFRITGAAADAGKSFQYAVSGTGAAAATALATVGADGTATVAVPVTNSANGQTVIVTSSAIPATVTMATRAISVGSVSAPLVVAAPLATVAVTGTVLDQFGAPVANATVTGSVTAGPNNGTVTTNALTAANGTFTVTYTDAAATASSSDTVTLIVTNGAYSGSPVTKVATVSYTASGVVTLTGLTLGTSNVTPEAFASTVVVPFGGDANTTVTGLVASTGNEVEVTATAAIAAPVTYTATGGFLSTTAGAEWDAGQTTVTAAAGTDVFFFSLTTGTATVTATAGDNTLTASIPVVTVAAAAYNIELSPEEQSVALGGFTTVTLTVSDVFGNPVPNTTTTAGTPAGGVTVSSSGDVLLSGLTNSVNISTGADGTASVTVIAGNAQGQGLLTAVPQTGNTAPAWATPSVTPDRAPAPVTSAAAEIGVGEAPIAPSILIEGSRENRRINIDGLTTGLVEGTEVYPFIRFPGQSGFTQGTAVRTVIIFDQLEQFGEFTWGRNTGKKTAVQFRDAAGLRSNTVTIAAR